MPSQTNQTLRFGTWRSLRPRFYNWLLDKERAVEEATAIVHAMPAQLEADWLKRFGAKIGLAAADTIGSCNDRRFAPIDGKRWF